MVENSVAVYALFNILSLFVSASLKVYSENKEQDLLDRIIQYYCVGGRGLRRKQRLLASVFHLM